jgi:regulator of replication initiation timing
VKVVEVEVKEDNLPLHTEINSLKEQILRLELEIDNLQGKVSESEIEKQGLRLKNDDLSNKVANL